MPCSEATLEIEKQNARSTTSLLQRLRLKAHLAICKWCSAYERKIVILDSKLNTLVEKEKHNDLKDIDIHEFKDVLKKKITK